MKLVNAALAKNKVKLENLSPEIQKGVSSLQDLIVKYNEACEEYEAEDDENKETEAQLDGMEAFIVKTETDLAEQINQAAADAKASAKAEEAAKLAAEAEEAAKAAADAEAAKAAAEAEEAAKLEAEKKPPEDKSSGGGWGWVAFGVFALVATVGAVNVFKKKG